MVVIAEIYKQLKPEIPNNIGRYTDTFYPTSSGDNFMKAGIPVILFEGGHFIDDYKRERTREFYTKALFYALAHGEIGVDDVVLGDDADHVVHRLVVLVHVHAVEEDLA